MKKYHLYVPTSNISVGTLISDNGNNRIEIERSLVHTVDPLPSFISIIESIQSQSKTKFIVSSEENKIVITEAPAFLHSALKQKAMDLLQVVLAKD